MQRHGPRHFTAYTITALVYFVIVFAIYYSQNHHFVSSKETQEKVIQMSLSTFVPEVPKEIVEEVIEEPVVEPEVKEEPIVEDVIPEPIIEKVVEKPVVKKVINKPKLKKKVLKKKIVKKKPIKKRKLKNRKKTKQTSVAKKSTKRKKTKANKSWPELQAKINKNKMYPRIAIKRRMEGLVEIKFTISSTGKVTILSQKGRKVFYKSARRAVEKSFPINPTKAPIELPSTITLKLHYVLRRN